MRSMDTLPGTNAIPIRRHENGFVVEGPGFYIWDEDPREVLRAARELMRGSHAVTPTTRLLILRDDFKPAPAPSAAPPGEAPAIAAVAAPADGGEIADVFSPAVHAHAPLSK